MLKSKPPRYILVHISKQHLKYKFNAAKADKERPRARGYQGDICDKFYASLVNRINGRGLKACIKINRKPKL